MSFPRKRESMVSYRLWTLAFARVTEESWRGRQKRGDEEATEEMFHGDDRRDASPLVGGDDRSQKV